MWRVINVHLCDPHTSDFDLAVLTGNNRRHVANQLHGTIGCDRRATSVRAKTIKHPEHPVKSRFDGASDPLPPPRRYAYDGGCLVGDAKPDPA